MKAPLTGNSITDRVMYTGMFVPEHSVDRDHQDQAAGSTNTGAVATPHDSTTDSAGVASIASAEA